MTDREPINGSILGVRDCGTLVIVFLSTDDERTVPVPMDRRAFGYLLEGEDCTPDELVGRCIKYDGNRILFLDRECPQ
jgi:hypothetical protein